MSLKSAIVIPARLESTRLPRKLLLNETGMTLIEHTWRAAQNSQLAASVVVATDSREIFDVVESFGGHALMTSADHQSGSDRTAEAVNSLAAEIIINLQGDEPEVTGNDIDLLIKRLETDTQIEVATLATPIHSREQLDDQANVKVVLNHAGHALYFSRSPIPAVKDASLLDQYFKQDSSSQDSTSAPFLSNQQPFLQHLGIYGYRRDCLLNLANLLPSALEELESLEQLRFLANGWKIGVEIVEQYGVGIDTPQDYAAFVKRVTNG